MPASARGPAARTFTEQQLGGPCDEYDSNPVCQVTATVLAQGNGDRVGLIIMNLGANTVYVSLNPNPSATNGIMLPPNGGVIGMSVRDDFTLPSRQWNGIALVGVSQMYILEVVRSIYTPGGE